MPVDALDLLSFQRLDVYQRAIELLALVRNIAEGAGRWSEADSANRYKIARGVRGIP